MLQHLGGKRCGNGCGHGAKVAQHGIGIPSTDELDDEWIGSSTKEGGGPAGSEAVGLDLGGRNPGGMLNCCGGGAQEWSDILGGGYSGGTRRATCRVYGVEWGFGRGVVLPKV